MAETGVFNHSVMDLLHQCRGRPVRVSLFDAHSRERLGRYPGILAEVLPESLRFDCLDVPPAVPVGTAATVEFARDGQVFWCHTSTLSVAARLPHVLHLALPIRIQSEQQRRSVRVEAHLPVHYLLDGSATPYQGMIINLSAGGAALHGPHPLEIGQVVALMFSLGSGLFFQDVRAEVVRVASTRAGAWVTGLRFLTLGTDQNEELTRWVSQHTHDQ